MKKSFLIAALLATAGLVQAQTAAPAAQSSATKVVPVAAEVTVLTATVDSVDANTRTVVLGGHAPDASSPYRHPRSRSAHPQGRMATRPLRLDAAPARGYLDA